MAILDDHKRRPAVLVIEDNEPLGSLLLTLLERDGFAVQWTTGGAEALRQTDARSFDAYVVDLVLSGRNGIGLIGGIPNEVARRTVVVTGVHDALLGALQSDVFAILRKPFGIEVFVDTVRRCCSGNGLKPVRLDPRSVVYPPPGNGVEGPVGGSSRGRRGNAPYVARRMAMLQEQMRSRR